MAWGKAGRPHRCLVGENHRRPESVAKVCAEKEPARIGSTLRSRSGAARGFGGPGRQVRLGDRHGSHRGHMPIRCHRSDSRGSGHTREGFASNEVISGRELANGVGDAHAGIGGNAYRSGPYSSCWSRWTSAGLLAHRSAQRSERQIPMSVVAGVSFHRVSRYAKPGGFHCSISRWRAASRRSDISDAKRFRTS